MEVGQLRGEDWTGFQQPEGLERDMRDSELGSEQMVLSNTYVGD